MPTRLLLVASTLVSTVATGQGQFAYSVSQDLPVQPVFPSHFVVQLDGPPPAAALSLPRALDLPIALGVVDAYEDLNGNQPPH